YAGYEYERSKSSLRTRKRGRGLGWCGDGPLRLGRGSRAAQPRLPIAESAQLLARGGAPGPVEHRVPHPGRAQAEDEAGRDAQAEVALAPAEELGEAVDGDRQAEEAEDDQAGRADAPPPARKDQSAEEQSGVERDAAVAEADLVAEDERRAVGELVAEVL